MRDVVYDPHAEARDRKARRERRFIEDNRKSVHEIERQMRGRKFNKPVRGGLRDFSPAAPDFEFNGGDR